MNPSVEMVLRDNLKSLRLPTINSCLEAHIRSALENSTSYEEFLLQLTDNELQVRNEKRHQRFLKEAKFPILKPLETFITAQTPDLDVRLIKELSSCDFIKSAQNVIFLGKSGTGKSHLATALGMKACELGYRTRFVTGCSLANELLEARDERRLSRILKRYFRVDLLIVDELGYVPFSKEGAELLFQVLAERYEKGAVMITSNLGFADWTRVFGDQAMTAALLDRLTHKARIINCNWQSYRLKQSMDERDSIKEKRDGDNSLRP
jgi:DNA replication protein DnaC